MIQIVQAPLEGALLLDGNNTLIKVKSSLGAGFYFRAKIYIEDELFDEQGWSRVDDYLATKDLLNFYRAYFKPIFLIDSFNGILEQNHLIKKVKIVVEEFDLIDDSLVNTVTLPEYFIHYSNKPYLFDDTVSFRLLEEANEVVMMPGGGKIAIPFYNIGEVDNVNVKVQKQDLTIVNSYNTTPYLGKKVFLFTYNLASASLTNDDQYLKIIFTKGTYVEERLIKLFKLPAYQVNLISYLGLFGYYKNVYFAGELEGENKYKLESYTNSQGQDITYEVNSETEFSLNTGSLLTNEKDIVHQVCTSLDIKFNFNFNFLNVVSKTVKNLFYKSRQHLFENELKLVTKSQPWIDNLTEVLLSYMSSFKITVNELELTPIGKDFILSYYSGATPLKIKFKNLGRGDIKIITALGESSMVNETEYDLVDIIGFSYISDDVTPPGFVSVGTTVLISVFDGFWSNYGTLDITILEEVISPPTEVPQPHYDDIQILRDASGNGTHTISPGFFRNYIWHVSDPDHPYTILWEVLGSPVGVSLLNTTTAYPTINTTNGSTESFQIKVTATCENGFGDQILNVNQYNNAIKLIRTYFNKYFYQGAQSWLLGTFNYDSVYKVINGAPGTTIDIVFEAQFRVGSPNYVVAIDFGLPSQQLFPYHGVFSLTKTFNASGEIRIPLVKLYHSGGILATADSGIRAYISITNNAAGMISSTQRTFNLDR